MSGRGGAKTCYPHHLVGILGPNSWPLQVSVEWVVFSLFCPCGLQWVRAEAGSGPGQPSEVLWPSPCHCQAPRTDLFGAGEVSALCLAEVAAPPQVWEGQDAEGLSQAQPPPLSPQRRSKYEEGLRQDGREQRLAEDLWAGAGFPDWVSACASCPSGRPRPQPGPEALL